MMSKTITLSLIVLSHALTSTFPDVNSGIHGLVNVPMLGWDALSNVTGSAFTVAADVESITDRLYSSPSGMFKQYSEPQENDTQSCDIRDTAVITIYATNSSAQSEIDVKLDGVPIGSLSTYFPDDGPTCKSPNAKGVITLMVPEGKHTIEATSPNLNWPGHTFKVNKCSCMLLPLS